jgi:hypothetical protein
MKTFLYFRSRVRHVALKSASPQVFFVVPQRKLWFSKAQLQSLRFKLLNATFNRNFYDCIWYDDTFWIGSYSVVVKSSA